MALVLTKGPKSSKVQPPESLGLFPTQEGGKTDLELRSFTFRFPALLAKGGLERRAQGKDLWVTHEHDSSGHIGHCGLFLRHVLYLVGRVSHLVLMLEGEL